MAQLYDQITSNKRKSILLMVLFLFFTVIVSFIFVEAIGIMMGSEVLGFVLFPVFIIVATVSTVGSYYYSDKVVLRISGAKPADKKEYPHLVNTVEGIAIAAGLPVPKIYVIEDPAPNAFATGRDPQHSAVAFTTGLLKKMDRYELEGVIAHEMSHIKNFDIRLATLAVVMVGFIAILSEFMLRFGFFSFGGRGRRGGGSSGSIIVVLALVLAILAPISAQLVRLAISRNREYLADATAALLTRNPDGLASALSKISSDNNKVMNATDATASLYISNPLKGKMLTGLFSTHPPIENRIKKLKAM